MSAEPDATASEVLQETQQNLNALVLAEVALLKQTVRKSVRRLALGAALILCAALLLLVALNVLAGTGVAALVEMGLAPVWAGLSVGAGMVLIGLVMIKLGASVLGRAANRMAKPVRNIGRDVQAVKAAFDGS